MADGASAKWKANANNEKEGRIDVLTIGFNHLQNSKFTSVI